MKSLKIYQGEDSQYQRLSNLKRMVPTVASENSPFFIFAEQRGGATDELP